jgi:mRNA-degrading endonuclease RelE of RelBE toxin-antitoxin system
LPPEVRDRIRQALEKLARDVGQQRRVGGKAVKTIHGSEDSFHRIRVGDHRVMHELMEDDRVMLILGIVHQSELERWIRGR